MVLKTNSMLRILIHGQHQKVKKPMMQFTLQFFDYQFRPLEKLYLSAGGRRDHHTTSGTYETGRITFLHIIKISTQNSEVVQELV